MAYVNFSLTGGTNDLRKYITDESVRAIFADYSSDAEIEAAVDEIINDVSAEIDARLARRYAVPFTSAPDVIANIAAVLAVEAFYIRANGSNEVIADAADAKRTILESIENGDLVIPGVSIATDDAAAPPTTAVSRGGEDRKMIFSDLEF